MMGDAEKIYNDAFNRGLRPDPITITVSEWSDRYRFLGSKSSSEPGKWRTSRTPFLREIMDSLSPQSPVKHIVFMKGAQVGGTECGNNWLGYCMDIAPGPFLFVQPTVDMVKRLTRQRIDPMIADTPRLAEKIGDQKSRDTSNSMFSKDFPGGILLLTGANSAVGLRSMPARYLFLDEVDAYPGDVNGEGDPVNLAIARTRTFRNRKILEVSTPKIEETSRIKRSFDRSDKRYYHIPCPHCRHKQKLVFANLKWSNDDPTTAKYMCESCGTLIEEHHKTWMMAEENGAEWVPENPDVTDVRGYHLNSLYSPIGWFSWAEIVDKWLKAKKILSELKEFVNTVLGETWVEDSDAPDWEVLYRKRETYRLNVAPEGVLFITAGVDIQRDRIEVEILGWGRNFETWSIDYRVFPGDTSQDEVWKRLWALRDEKWKSAHPDGGEFKLSQMAVDSSDQTAIVYNQVRLQADSRIMAVKGMSDTFMQIVGSPKVVDIDFNGKTIYRGVQFWPVGVSMIKTELYGWLRQLPPLNEGDPYPTGYCHHPEYSEDYFKQITAEKKVRKVVGGRSTVVWQKVYERNEALDTRVYNRAAAFVFGIDRFTEAHWEQLENALEMQRKKGQNDPQDKQGKPKPVNPYTKSTGPWR